MSIISTHYKFNNMKFGEALVQLNNGLMVAREGWNGKGMFIFQQIGNTVAESFIPNFKSLPDSVKAFLQAKGGDVVFNSSLTMFTAKGEMQPGWLASQADILASDWTLVTADSSTHSNAGGVDESAPADEAPKEKAAD